MTATTTTIPASKPIHRQKALWAGMALMFSGAVLGSAAVLVIDDDAPARPATVLDASSREALAEGSDRYVEGLERQATAVAGAGTHLSADAAERWASSAVPGAGTHLSADAAERWASGASSPSVDYAEPGAYPHGFDYSNVDESTCAIVHGPC